MLESTGWGLLDVKSAHWLPLTDIILGNLLRSQGFFFPSLSDSQQEANWTEDNSRLLSSPTDLQIEEAHLNSDGVSSPQLLHLTLFPHQQQLACQPK